MPSASRSRHPRSLFGHTVASVVRTLSVFSVAALLVTAGGATSSPSAAYAGTAEISPSQAPKPPPTIWGACPNNGREGAEHKLVRQFQRGPGAAVAATMHGGTSDLVCGHDAYGYYHIVNRHFIEWNEKSIRTSENWRHVADYAIAEALQSPHTVTFRATNNTFCYSREIYLVNKVNGMIVDVFHPNVVIRQSDSRIITAFPAREPCRG
jgi:hypothetical protein